MSEKKEIKKAVADDDLDAIAGGAAGEMLIYNFRCSCGNVVMRGNQQFPKFPCPKCMKREWEYVGVTVPTRPVPQMPMPMQELRISGHEETAENAVGLKPAFTKQGSSIE